MIVKFKIPDNIYFDLLEVIKNKTKSYVKNLAGNIREEYYIGDYINKLQPFIISAIENSLLINHVKEQKILFPYSQKLVLDSLWVNYQKKYEFNPMHTHDGLCSFILFMKIPFLMEEEFKDSPGINTKQNKAGHLGFFCLNSNIKGCIEELVIPVDKTFEKTGFLFKADLNHCVYPFYSSDDYRITISGNVSFGNEGLKK
tara:strand:- start:31 stop:630 length:600 start_codon:yes stop_codon:yes gene_type:complete